jgi:hypothetical protein
VVGSYLELFRKAGKAEIASVRNSKKIVENTKATSKITSTIVSNTKKLTAEQAKQLELKKAQAILDGSSKVMDMDLIQNTAALMGKVTADETLRLKLQQAILLGNSTEAGNLAQQLLASQYAAMKLSSTNPLGGFTDALQAALKGVRDLRNELAALGAPKVSIPSMAAAAATSTLATATPGFSTINGISLPPSFAGFGPARNNNSLPPGFEGFGPAANNTREIRITLDPKASQLINAEVVKANANGSSSTVNRNGFFNYGG